MGAVLAVAFVLRVLLVVTLRDAPYFEEPILDSKAYDDWALRIATEDFWGSEVFYQDPLYPYGLGIFYAVFGHSLLWVRLFQCALGTFGLWMLFEAVRRFLDYRTAMVALVLGALTKTFIFYDAALLKDFLGVVAIEAALFFWSLDRTWKWLAFGAVLGLGTLVRGNLLLVSLAAAGFLATRKEWKAAGLTVAGTVLAILPCTVRNLAVAGDFVPTTAQLGPNLYTGNNPGNTTGRYLPPPFVGPGAPKYERTGFHKEAERRTEPPLKASEVDAYWRNEALDYILGHPGTFIGVTLRRAALLVSSYEIPDNYNLYFTARFSWVLKLPLFTFALFTAPLAIAGLYLSWMDRSRFALLYVLLAAYALSIIFFFMFARYRLPLVPLLIVFAAHAAVKTAQMLKWRMRRVPMTAGIISVVAMLLMFVPSLTGLTGHRDFRTAHRNLGLYYRDKERHAEAAAEFEAAAKLDPDFLKDPVFVMTLARLLQESGQLEKAFEHYNSAMRLAPRAPEPPYHVGLIYLEKGMDRQAAEALEEAIARDPSYAAAYVPLATAHLRLKQPHVALDFLDLGERALPKIPEIPLEKARIYRTLSLWKKAVRAAESVLKLLPDDEAARRLLDEARKRLR